MLPLLLMAALSTAHAAEPGDLDRAWYLAESSRIEEAATAVATRLREHPDDIAAHRLNVWLQVKALRNADGAEALYRSWLDEDPEALPPRVALANLLHWRHRRLGPWCEEAEELLEAAPADLEAAYWTQRALYEMRRTCPGDTETPRQALVKLGETVPAASAYGLRLRVSEQAITPKLAQELDAFYDEQPWRLTYAGNLWRKTRGEALETARERALEAARANLASEDSLLVESARRLFHHAQEHEATLEAEERLLVLDPDFVRNQFQREGSTQWVARPEDAEDPLIRKLRGATRRVGKRKAVSVARALEPQVPADGSVRAAYFDEMATLLDEANRPVKALEARREAWRAAPDDPLLANAFAYDAAVAGLYLDEALEAIQDAVLELPAYDPRGDHPAPGYDPWVDGSRAWSSAIADTHGWVLHGLDRHEEAAATLRQALLLAPAPNPTIHLHLGLVYAASDDAQGALRHLGRGLALAEGETPELERQAYKQLVPLYQAHAWAPGGLEAWIALRAPAPSDEPNDEKASEREQAKAYRIGQPFPDLAFEQDGAHRKLSEIEGLRVVDLWATWCGPCVRALPSMDKLAKQYEGRVTFVALSVDGDMAEVESFFEGDDPRWLVLGWAGRRAMREAKVTGIPAMFVIDAQGVVRDFHSGWGLGRGGDKAARERVAASLDALLAGQDAAEAKE